MQQEKEKLGIRNSNLLTQINNNKLRSLKSLSQDQTLFKLISSTLFKIQVRDAKPANGKIQESKWNLLGTC